MSGISVLSTSSCNHASVAKNGTTFSGKKMKYNFHYSQNAGLTGEDYLTPTQRAQKQVRYLKCLLHQAHKDLEQKDSVITELTKEVAELRLYASLSTPAERSISSDAVTFPENQMDYDLAIPIIVNSEMTEFCTDSGDYLDNTYIIYSEDTELFSDNIAHSSFEDSRPETVDSCVSTDDIQYEDLVSAYESRIQELVKSHENESQIQRQKHGDEVENMVQLIADINKRYWDMVPDLKNAKDRIKELESHVKDLEYSSKSNSSMSLLSAKEAVTLCVLDAKKAMHKKLLEAMNKKVNPKTDKKNSHGHFKSIQYIVGFSPEEVQNIEKAWNLLTYSCSLGGSMIKKAMTKKMLTKMSYDELVYMKLYAIMLMNHISSKASYTL